MCIKILITCLNVINRRSFLHEIILIYNLIPCFFYVKLIGVYVFTYVHSNLNLSPVKRASAFSTILLQKYPRSLDFIHLSFSSQFVCSFSLSLFLYLFLYFSLGVMFKNNLTSLINLCNYRSDLQQVTYKVLLDIFHH